MNVNVYSTGATPLLKIRCIGCNRSAYQVNIGPMLRNSYIIHYVMSGRGVYNGNPVNAGQGFLIVPGNMEEYHADPSDPWELFWVVSEDPDMEKIFSAFDADPKTGIFDYDYIDAVLRGADAVRLLTKRLVSGAEILELFLGVYKYQEQGNVIESEKSICHSYVDFALQYIRMNYQSHVTVHELSEIIGVSQSYLFRIFKEITGKSPRQYLVDYRLLQAKKLLKETTMTITQVAASVGYPDALAFSKFFMCHQGVSPRKYRQSILDSV